MASHVEDRGFRHGLAICEFFEINVSKLTFENIVQFQSTPPNPFRSERSPVASSGKYKLDGIIITSVD